jgi:hypothetical protein
LVNRKANSPPVQTRVQILTTQKTIEELQEEIRLAEAQVTASQESVDDLPTFNAEALAKLDAELQQDLERLGQELADLKAKANQKMQQAGQVQAADDRDKESSEEEVKDLEGQIADIEQKIKDVEGSNRVYFKSDLQGKTVWLVQVDASGMTVAQMDVQSSPRAFATAAEFEKWLLGLGLSDNALFLLVKPGGAAFFDELEPKLVNVIDFGYQVVGANQQILDPIIGAGRP